MELEAGYHQGEDTQRKMSCSSSGSKPPSTHQLLAGTFAILAHCPYQATLYNIELNYDFKLFIYLLKREKELGQSFTCERAIVVIDEAHTNVH